MARSQHSVGRAGFFPVVTIARKFDEFLNIKEGPSWGGSSDFMTATAIASCPCISDYVFCTWSGCRNKLKWGVLSDNFISIIFRSRDLFLFV